MEFNVPHLVVTALAIFTTVFLVEHFGKLRNASRTTRVIITGAVIFLAMLIIDLLWPYAPG